MPRKPLNGVPRTKRIPLEVTPAEHAAIKAWADRQGLGVGPAIRTLLYRQGAMPPPAPPGELVPPRPAAR